MELWVTGIQTFQTSLRACDYGDFAGYFDAVFVIDEYGEKEPKAFSCFI